VTEGSIFPTRPMDRVREGMTVVDAAGRRLGKVVRLRLGDPEAATTEGNEPTGDAAGVVFAPAASTGGTPAVGGAVPFARGADDEDDVPASLQRTGFLELDGPGLAGAERYVAADRVTEVSGDTVQLSAVPTTTGL